MSVTINKKTNPVLDTPFHKISQDLIPLATPLDALRPDPLNARSHTPGSIAEVAKSLDLYGQRKPIVVNKNTGFVLAGNGTLAAAQHLGWSHLAVVKVEDDPDTAIGFAIADNRTAELSSWDESGLKELLDGLDRPGDIPGVTDDWMQNLGVDPNAKQKKDPEDIPQVPARPVSVADDVWLLGDHRLMCGSSTVAKDVKKLMQGERAILFATDPPYLVGYDGTNHPKSTKTKKKAKAAALKGVDAPEDKTNKDWSGTYGLTWDDAAQGTKLWDDFIAVAMKEAVKENAAWYCWYASSRHTWLEACWDKAGAFIHQQIIWVKNAPVLSFSHYMQQSEVCLYGWIRGKKPIKVDRKILSNVWQGHGDPTDEGMIKQPCPSCLSNVWHIKGLAGKDRPDHPTPKPLACFTIPMRQHVPKGGLCYEPFSGSGSQIMAGEVSSRKVYAMELSPVYVDVAVRRFIEATGKDVVLEGSGKSYFDVAKDRKVKLDWG